MGLTADQILQKKKVVHLETQQQKLSKITYREKINKTNEKSICEMWDNFKQPSVCVTRVLKGEREDRKSF